MSAEWMTKGDDRSRDRRDLAPLGWRQILRRLNGVDRGSDPARARAGMIILEIAFYIVFFGAILAGLLSLLEIPE